MEFRFETNYDQKALKAMAHALRKTVRKKRIRRSNVFGTATMALGLLLIVSAEEFGMRQWLTAAVIALIALTFLFQDGLNGYVAAKRSLPGLDKAVTIFTEQGYHSITPVGESNFPYSNIRMIVEDREYFIFVFSASHAQVYDKRSITGGTAADFTAFIKEITHLEWIKL